VNYEAAQTYLAVGFTPEQSVFLAQHYFALSEPIRRRSDFARVAASFRQVAVAAQRFGVEVDPASLSGEAFDGEPEPCSCAAREWIRKMMRKQELAAAATLRRLRKN
jgi:hypothetical protein